MPYLFAVEIELSPNPPSSFGEQTRAHATEVNPRLRISPVQMKFRIAASIGIWDKVED